MTASKKINTCLIVKVLLFWKTNNLHLGNKLGVGKSLSWFFEPTTNIINTAIDTSTLPDRAKRASVISIDKGVDNKHIYTNYRPVRVLSTFSKIIKLAIFDQLTKHAKHFLSIFVSAYRKMYGTQHVLIRLLEEWREQTDHNKIVGTVLLDLSKAFECIPHDLLMSNLTLMVSVRTPLLHFFLSKKQKAIC